MSIRIIDMAENEQIADHRSRLEILLDQNSGIEYLRPVGFDDCIIGTVDDKLVYSVSAIIKQMMSKSISYIDAREDVDYNIVGTYAGENTPIFVEDEIFNPI